MLAWRCASWLTVMHLLEGDFYPGRAAPAATMHVYAVTASLWETQQCGVEQSWSARDAKRPS